MSRTCAVTKKKVTVGHNVSHANNKTKRTFMPNLQKVSLLSEILGSNVRLKVSVRGLKTIEKKGGIDAYLLSTPNSRLSDEALILKKRVKKAAEKKAA
jgi:large subunit ribosomal protein L28